MDTEHTINALWELAQTSPSREANRLHETRLMEVIDALIVTEDPALMAFLPALLSQSVEKGLLMNDESLGGRYRTNSRQHMILEKLLLVTFSFLKNENLSLSPDAADHEMLLKTRWGDLGSRDVLDLGNGLLLQMESLHKAFKQHRGTPPGIQTAVTRQNHRPSGPPHNPHRNLRLLFAPKQEALILKRLNGEEFTKTEREYYSRVVKKKLRAIADPDLQQLASRLVDD